MQRTAGACHNPAEWQARERLPQGIQVGLHELILNAQAGVPHATAAGGPWLCRVRFPSGLMAVVVPSLLSLIFQPHL
jgi:hypothetical protein